MSRDIERQLENLMLPNTSIKIGVSSPEAPFLFPANVIAGVIQRPPQVAQGGVERGEGPLSHGIPLRGGKHGEVRVLDAAPARLLVPEPDACFGEDHAAKCAALSGPAAQRISTGNV